ncbi:MAG TPA: stage II sporulation protein M [Bacteroidales bacterium]|nr:stage II sporulation protein M [Bacteroidales bacterium]
MNEIRFLHTNQHHWKEFEELLETGYQSNPDQISDLYIRLTDDLSYARTYFTNSPVNGYLNNLAQKAHRLIYQNKPVKSNLFVHFWKTEYPTIVKGSYREITVSFLILLLASMTGWLSNLFDPEFARIIMGDHYINMTLANIEKGDPLAVYKSMNQVDMFLGITLNNIYVAFQAFVCGLFTPLGTGMILLKNGIMLGTFHSFLMQKGFSFETISTIWIHGTIEIFSIIVAGAAGIILGKGIVFPGTYKRSVSFRMGALKGIKLVAGLIPFFIVAGFLEGFITRYTHAPFVLRLSIIILSAVILAYYFFIYPNTSQFKNPYYGKQSG